jgi:hypothetical protein
MGLEELVETMALRYRVHFMLVKILIYNRKIQIAAIRNETSRNGLGVLLKILCGDRDTMADVSESWQEYVASMAFFAKPFALNSYKDVQELYDDAMAYGFNIDNTLPSEIASSALFTADLPRVSSSRNWLITRRW